MVVASSVNFLMRKKGSLDIGVCFLPLALPGGELGYFKYSALCDVELLLLPANMGLIHQKCIVMATLGTAMSHLHWVLDFSKMDGALVVLATPSTPSHNALILLYDKYLNCRQRSLRPSPEVVSRCPHPYLSG